MENPIKMDDLGVPLFLETPKWSPVQWFVLNIHFAHTFWVKVSGMIWIGWMRVDSLLRDFKFIQVVAIQTFLIFIPSLGEMIQFDKHILQMGSFNHQLVICDLNFGYPPWN